MQKLIQTFLDLAEIDEVYPNEDKVISYIKRRLDAAGVAHQQDAFGSIIATLPGQNADALALVAHIDIAAPLNGRKVITTDTVIKTDGTSILGADDKAAVACLLELADHIYQLKTAGTSKDVLPRSLQFIFTRGEEAGCLGATNLDMSMVSASQAVVPDWVGRVNRVITASPAMFKIDVLYHGKDAHAAFWRDGKNAGAAIMAAASALRQGDYGQDVSLNIGIASFGKARNQVPGEARLEAEVRSFDADKARTAAQAIQQHFEEVAAKFEVAPEVTVIGATSAYRLNKEGGLLRDVTAALQKIGLEPQFEETFGGFDANPLAAKGMEVVIVGAGYYNPHGSAEYIELQEFEEMYKFVQGLCLGE